MFKIHQSIICHVAVDIKKKRILSLEITSEEVHDGNMLKKLVDNASENNEVKRALADGMYDSNNNFRYLSKNHIKPGIKARSNSKVKSQIRGLTGYIDEMWELRPQGAKQALTTEYWKYIRYLTGMYEEFYELQTDPNETANVIESVKNNAPQFLKQLRVRCNEALWKSGRAVAMDEKEKAIVEARLRGLGYIR